MVSRPTYVGGLGFGMKWDMGWMHDTLVYMGQDPVHRKYHHNKLSFRLVYAFTENFVLPLSHDEVVHGKGSLIGKMPGDTWQKFANMRVLYGYMYGQPGKKLLFMGGEFGQWREWNHDEQPRLAPPRGSLARGSLPLGGGDQRSLPERAGAARARFRPGRVRVGRLQRWRAERPFVSAEGEIHGRHLPRRLQLHSRPEAQLPRGSAPRGVLAGGA